MARHSAGPVGSLVCAFSRLRFTQGYPAHLRRQFFSLQLDGSSRSPGVSARFTPSAKVGARHLLAPGTSQCAVQLAFSRCLVWASSGRGRESREKELK